MTLLKNDSHIWVMTRELLSGGHRYPLRWISSDTRAGCWLHYHSRFTEKASKGNREAAKKQSFKPMKFKLVPVKGGTK